jgi:hypothetical protein
MSDSFTSGEGGAAGGAREQAIHELASFYEYLASAEFDGYCDLYARIARGVAADRELLGIIDSFASSTKVLPILVFAAVHSLVLAEPDLELAAIYRGDPGDPWPAFRRLLIDRVDAIRELAATRSVQTNEVARSSVLLPALTAVHRRARRPLALIEIGPSAGLNLLLDRYGYDFGDGREVGDRRSPVQLRCEVRGPLTPPLAGAPPPIASRTGIDLEPIDVRDEDSCRWLEACLWPTVPDRAERLRAALAVARVDPPLLHRGAALDVLPDVLAGLDADVVPCIISTWVLAYFAKEDRDAFHVLLEGTGRDRDLACITAEYPSVAPWVSRPDREASGNPGQGASVLGMAWWHDGLTEHRTLGWNHAHGTWIDWLDEATADG